MVVVFMAAIKMTFSIPASLAAEFSRSVPARQRSQYLAEALRTRLAQRDQELAAACDLANSFEDGVEIEREFDALASEGLEPWDASSPR
jgi:hypothetical protein